MRSSRVRPGPVQATIAHAVSAARAASIPPNRRVFGMEPEEAGSLHSSGGLTV